MFGMDLMKKLKEAQEAMGHMDVKLTQMRVEYSSGGNMVTVTINGKKEILDVKIDPAVIDPDDVEMLQDLIVAAIRGAHNKVDDEIKESMDDMLGGIDLPGINEIVDT